MTADKLLLLLFLAAGVSADYWTDRGYTYEVYEIDVPANPQNVYQQQRQPQQQYYPHQYYPQQQQQYYPQQHNHYQQQKQYYPQVQVTQQPNHNRFNQQTTPSVSVSEAEWVCTNPKTQDMMIIASEDMPSRVNGQQQWHQVNPQQPGNNQPNYPTQPQQPVYPQTQAPPVTNAPTTTTEDTYRPIWGTSGDDNRYPQTQAPVTSKPTTTTTTEDTNRPIWGESSKQPSFPEVKPSFPTSTTQKPFDPLWPVGGGGNKPGFTVIEPTSKPIPKTTKSPFDDEDDDGPLEIVMG